MEKKLCIQNFMKMKKWDRTFSNFDHLWLFSLSKKWSFLLWSRNEIAVRIDSHYLELLSMQLAIRAMKNAKVTLALHYDPHIDTAQGKHCTSFVRRAIWRRLQHLQKCRPYRRFRIWHQSTRFHEVYHPQILRKCGLVHHFLRWCHLQFLRDAIAPLPP